MRMIERGRVVEIATSYAKKDIAIGVLASHSALDVCDGAVAEGFRTVAVCEQGRDRTYTQHFRCRRDAKGGVLRGIVDDPIVLEKFAQITTQKVQEELRARQVIFVPNRALTSYCSVEAVENDFAVPLFGSRALLRTEERGEQRDYYWLLQQAGLPFPRPLRTPEEIDRLVIVKLPHKEKALERGFFTAASPEEFKEKSEQLLRQNVISPQDLGEARIEEYIIGPVFNLNFFYSPLAEKGEEIELLGIDWRFESSLDGHVRLPAPQQMRLPPSQAIPEYTVCGHNSATLRESLLEKGFGLAEKFVKAAAEHFPPGIIGPFCLQTCVDQDLRFHIYDVAPRIGGGTNIHMAIGHPYGNALWRTEMSTGRRIARELRSAIASERLGAVVT